MRLQALSPSKAVALMHSAIARGLQAVHRRHSWLDEPQTVLWMVPPTRFWVQAASDLVSQLDRRLRLFCVMWPRCKLRPQVVRQASRAGTASVVLCCGVKLLAQLRSVEGPSAVSCSWGRGCAPWPARWCPGFLVRWDCRPSSAWGRPQSTFCSGAGSGAGQRRRVQLWAGCCSCSGSLVVWPWKLCST